MLVEQVPNSDQINTVNSFKSPFWGSKTTFTDEEGNIINNTINSEDYNKKIKQISNENFQYMLNADNWDWGQINMSHLLKGTKNDLFLYLDSLSDNNFSKQSSLELLDCIHRVNNINICLDKDEESELSSIIKKYCLENSNKNLNLFLINDKIKIQNSLKNVFKRAMDEHIAKIANPEHHILVSDKKRYSWWYNKDLEAAAVDYNNSSRARFMLLCSKPLIIRQSSKII